MVRISKNVPVHIFISRAMDAAAPVQDGKDKLTREDVMSALGYDSPNMISMLRNGRTKLPTNKVKAMADVLGVDRFDLFRRCMMEYKPGEWEVLQEILGDQLMTQNERRFLAAVRAVTGSEDVDYVGDDAFMERLRPLLEIVTDRHAVTELADRGDKGDPRSTRSPLSQANKEMAALLQRQAIERLELRKKIGDLGGDVFNNKVAAAG